MLRQAPRQQASLLEPGAAPPSQRRALSPLQSQADRSPRTLALAQLQAAAGAWAGAPRRDPAAPAQLKDPRSRNPHNPHTGITSHHVIPHELLGTLLDKFKGKKGKDGAPDIPDERAEVMRGFLPPFDALTLANFVAITSIKVAYDGVSPNKVTELPGEIATLPFAELEAQDRAKTRFTVEDAGVVDFTAFERLYGQLLRGEAVETEGGEAVSGLRDLGDAFYEWQGGNLFYGPERIEPGAKDGFDYDAALIYGEAHASKLAAIYTQLRALEASDDPGSKAEIRRLLAEMAAATKAAGVPKYDPAQWCPIDSAAKQTVHDVLLPKRGATSKVGASIHVEVLRRALRPYCKDNSHPLLVYMGRSENLADGQSSPDTLFEAKRARLYLKAVPGQAADVPVLRKVGDVQKAMTGVLESLFGL